jgi:hypothetical protein
MCRIRPRNVSHPTVDLAGKTGAPGAPVIENGHHQGIAGRVFKPDVPAPIVIEVIGLCRIPATVEARGGCRGVTPYRSITVTSAPHSPHKQSPSPGHIHVSGSSLVPYVPGATSTVSPPTAESNPAFIVGHSDGTDQIRPQTIPGRLNSKASHSNTGRG